MPGRPLVVLLLADGARPDVLGALLEGGQLPHLAEHVTGPGSFLTLTTTFPSTTGPAYLPFLTGRFPGTLNIPGIRWLDKSAYLDKPRGPDCLRSYCGPQVTRINRDYPPEVPTVFDLFDRPFNVASFFSRNLPAGHDLVARGRRSRYFYSHVMERWTFMDRASRRALLGCLERDPDFVFCVFPGIDAASHYRHPQHEETEAAYRFLDESVGLLVEALRERGRWEQTLLLVTADHGLTATSRHLDLARFFERRGVRTLAHPLIYRRRPELGVMISGNAAGLVYWLGEAGPDRNPGRALRRRLTGIWEELLQREEVDLVVRRRGDNDLEVESAGGRGRILGGWREGLRYLPEDGDPLGLGEIGRALDTEEALAATFQSAYPDALVQLAQLFESPRAGDAVVTSPAGADLRRYFEFPEHRGSHGSLCREHMLVPLLVNQPGWGPGPARTVDVFPSLVEWAGRPLPGGLAGRKLY